MKMAFASLLVASLAACSPSADGSPDDARGSPTAEATAAETPVAAMPAALSPSGETPDGSDMAYEGPIPMPIMVGNNGPETDGCGTLAKVASLDGQNVDYLSVRDAPSGSTKERDRLNPGRQVAVCAIKGEWSGVVYAEPGDDTQDCGVASPVATEEPYRGPCRQGWVVTQYLEVVAG